MEFRLWLKWLIWERNGLGLPTAIDAPSFKNKPKLEAD